MRISLTAARLRLLHVGVASIVLLGAALLLSVGLADAIASSWDPCATVSAGIFGGLGGVLGWLQYMAAFRRRCSFGTAVAVILMASGGLVVLAVSIGNAELVLESGFQTDVLPFGLEILAAGAGTIIVGFLSGYCARQERNIQREKPAAGNAAACASSERKRQFTLAELFIATTFIAAVAGFTTALVHSTHPRFAEGVDAQQAPVGLPADAHDINYVQGFRGTFACEFSASESAFRDWVAEGIGSIESLAAHPALKVITSPVHVHDWGGPHGVKVGNVVVTSGLVYEWRKADRGVKAVWDRATGRAYYEFHSH